MLQKTGSFDKVIENAIVENLIHPGSRKETLESVYQPTTPLEPANFFSFLRTNISLNSTGMGGIVLRESKNNLLSLVEKEGFDYFICKSFINDFEDEILKQYYEKQKKDD